MAAKRASPAQGNAGPEIVAHDQAIDTPENIPAAASKQPHPSSLAARRLFDDMIAHGAVFEILRRDAREVSFVYKLRPNASDADRARCRHIVADVKDTGAISQFIAAIVELEEARR